MTKCTPKLCLLFGRHDTNSWQVQQLGCVANYVDLMWVLMPAGAICSKEQCSTNNWKYQVLIRSVSQFFIMCMFFC
jgi:hypothetical protein